jgi:hypothetical protein
MNMGKPAVGCSAAQPGPFMLVKEWLTDAACTASPSDLSDNKVMLELDHPPLLSLSCPIICHRKD